ncbi:MAG TPA: hypothetical protein VKU01_25240 [Bryobacteraceae bacterium]|nr:hypothetical protein [Bryobacteraceae bacterium]
MTAAGVTELLVSKGLTAIGSPITIQELGRKYRIRRWYDFWDVIYLPPSPLFDENAQPYFVQNDDSHRLPPTTFYNDFDLLHDGQRNHDFALDRLTRVFGEPPKDTSVSNTRSHTWKFEEMSVNILTFIQEKTSGHNPLYRRHPELWNQCRITIERNWLWDVSPMERACLDSLSADDTLPCARIAIVQEPPLRERGLLRRAPDRRNSYLWRSPDRARIGWHAGDRALFIDRAICKGLTLEQVTPARGCGYSRVKLEWKNPFSDAHETVQLGLLNGAETHTLDNFAEELAGFWRIKLKSVEYPDD